MVPVHSIGVWSVGGWEQDMSPEAPPIGEAKEHDPVVQAAVVVLVLESLWCQLTRGVKIFPPFSPVFCSVATMHFSTDAYYIRVT